MNEENSRYFLIPFEAVTKISNITDIDKGEYLVVVTNGGFPNRAKTVEGIREFIGKDRSAMVQILTICEMSKSDYEEWKST